MAEKRDYYEILGVEKGADEKALKSAYRKLALKFHPDKNPAPDSAERFKEISAAYAILSDPEKRARYDQFGHAGIDAQYSQEDIFRGVDFSEIFGQAGGLGDIFSRIFGGGMGGFGGGYGGDPRQGRSIEHPYEISLEDAYSGQKAEVELRRLENCTTCKGSGSADGKVTSCRTCGGRGQVAQVSRTPFGVMQRVGMCPACRGEGETITKPCMACKGEGRLPKTRRLQLTIPAGVDDGMRLRLSGEGEAGPRGGPSGDLYLTIHIRAHARYERDGADLFAELPLSVPRAALGGRIPVPTLDGVVDVEIPPGVQSGKRLRLAGKGMPRVRGGGHGDLYLVTQVLTPERMTPKARHLMEQLGEELGDAAPSGKKKTLVDRVVDAFKPD